MTRETLLTDVFKGTSAKGDGSISRRRGNAALRSRADGAIVRGRRDNTSDSAQQREGGERPLGDL